MKHEGKRLCAGKLPLAAAHTLPSVRRTGERGHRIDRQRGFSLIELVAIVVIIGVLAVIAVPRYIAIGRDCPDRCGQHDGGHAEFDGGQRLRNVQTGSQLRLQQFGPNRNDRRPAGICRLWMALFLDFRRRRWADLDQLRGLHCNCAWTERDRPVCARRLAGSVDLLGHFRRRIRHRANGPFDHHCDQRLLKAAYFHGAFSRIGKRLRQETVPTSNGELPGVPCRPIA